MFQKEMEIPQKFGKILQTETTLSKRKSSLQPCQEGKFIKQEEKK